MNDPYEFIWNELFEPKEERGDEFEVESKSSKKIRCNCCQKEYRKQWDRLRKNKNSTLQNQ